MLVTHQLKTLLWSQAACTLGSLLLQGSFWLTPSFELPVSYLRACVVQGREQS